MATARPPAQAVIDYTAQVARSLQRPIRRCEHPHHGRSCTAACPPAVPALVLALDLADALADHGYPSSTLGTGSRGSDTTSSTERAALDPDSWAGIDATLAAQMRDLYRALLAVDATVARVTAHAATVDRVPAGRGPCQCGCGHVCRPERDPDDRLRTGLAPACYARFRRWRAENPGVTKADYVAACARERVSTT